MAKTNTPTIASAVIDKFGGLTATARALSTEDNRFPVTTVQGWRVRGEIPTEHWAALIEAGQQRGVELQVADFLPPELAARVVAA